MLVAIGHLRKPLTALMTGVRALTCMFSEVAPDVASLVKDLTAAVEQAAIVLLQDSGVVLFNLNFLVLVFRDSFKQVSLSLGIQLE